VRDRPNSSSLQTCDLDSVMEFGLYSDLTVSQKVSVRQLGFFKKMTLKAVSTVQRVNMRHLAKVCGDRSNRC